MANMDELSICSTCIESVVTLTLAGGHTVSRTYKSLGIIFLHAFGKIGMKFDVMSKQIEMNIQILFLLFLFCFVLFFF